MKLYGRQLELHNGRDLLVFRGQPELRKFIQHRILIVHERCSNEYYSNICYVRERKLKHHEKSSICKTYNSPRAGIIFVTFPIISLINNQVVESSNRPILQFSKFPNFPLGVLQIFSSSNIESRKKAN